MYPYTCTSGLSPIEVRIEYANWLNSMEWGFFGTFTTNYPMSVASARRAAERLYSNLQKNLGGIRIFWVAEPFDTKYGYHLHALVHFNNPALKGAKELIKKAWQVVTKGKNGKEYHNTVIKPYDKELGANYYVSKYMMKYNSDYDILCAK